MCPGLYLITHLKKFFEVHRDTVSKWLDHWERDGIVGLLDEARSGRPPICTVSKQAKSKVGVDQSPHPLKDVVAQFQEETGKDVSLYTYKRFLKKYDYAWKRCRHALQSLRNESYFRQEQQDQVLLRQHEIEGNVKIYYFDGAGFSTAPNIPYAWKKIGNTLQTEPAPQCAWLYEPGKQCVFLFSRRECDIGLCGSGCLTTSPRSAFTNAHRPPRRLVWPSSTTLPFSTVKQ